ncbi:glycoside hydrolase family protein [Adhaeribacter pallidiroseus]|uniref:Glycosyl hydrolase family 32 N-terminal domain-containing protein n=1 Tax=Adhaeribacter pallidiroseus TaxID=2072847 RepID=A0A369QGR5_9BACT|nr:hypothetical protein [Adhaeribacter pallidiroseus]RDC64121.1 uncharacterized protein AHMF7616_02731 [Adhaeribacter pallidiroseus]
MRWRKLGLVFEPNKALWWQQYYGILPTPIYIENLRVIRVFFSTACNDRFGRVTFIDVDAANPINVVYNHQDYILDIGKLGAFDDCGVNISAVINIDHNWYMYYAGYQRHYRTPFSILSGLAKSQDGITFSRYQDTPILERTNYELSLRSAPTIMVEDGIFKMWYVSDFGWKNIDSPHFKGKLMPLYCLKYGTSLNGINWDVTEEPVFKPVNDEFGFGRPYIYKDSKCYKLFYSIRRENVTYRLGYAESLDGIQWVRKDQEVGIDVSPEGWDSEMICYPAVISVKNKTYLFYNGNNNGETGFGVAELIEE